MPTVTYHNPSVCAGEACTLHNPSDHHMAAWPLVLRESGLMERKCPHGVGHPDPDSVAWAEANGPEACRASWRIHGCDGCCASPEF